MAQKRYWNYKDDDYTLDVNQDLNSVIPTGRYRGFDNNEGSGLSLVLNHNTTGYTKVDINSSATNNIGAWISRQGVVITEDDTITLAVNANNTDEERIDLVVGTHKYLQVVGGQQAVYSIVEGTAGAGQPSLVNENIDVLLGILKIPAQSTDLDNATWIPSNPPMFGNNSNVALKNLENIFTQQNQFAGLGVNKIYDAELIPPAGGGFNIFFGLKFNVINSDNVNSVASEYKLLIHPNYDVNADDFVIYVAYSDPLHTEIPEGWRITLETPYRLVFTGGTGFSFLSSFGETSLNYVVERGSKVTLQKGKDGTWIVYDATYDLNRNNKLYGQQIFNSVEAILTANGRIGGSSSIMDKGNIWDIKPVSTGLSEIKFIHAPTIGFNSGDPDSNQGGRILVLNPTDDTELTLVDKSNAGTIPTDYKALDLGGADISVTSKAILLVENEDYFRVLNLDIANKVLPEWKNVIEVDGDKTNTVAGRDVQYRIENNKITFRGEFEIVAGSQGNICKVATGDAPDRYVNIPIIMRQTGWDYSSLTGGASNESIAILLAFNEVGEINLAGGAGTTQNHRLIFDGITFDIY